MTGELPIQPTIYAFVDGHVRWQKGMGPSSAYAGCRGFDYDGVTGTNAPTGRPLAAAITSNPHFFQAKKPPPGPLA